MTRSDQRPILIPGLVRRILRAALVEVRHSHRFRLAAPMRRRSGADQQRRLAGQVLGYLGDNVALQGAVGRTAVRVTREVTPATAQVLAKSRIIPDAYQKIIRRIASATSPAA